MVQTTPSILQKMHTPLLRHDCHRAHIFSQISFVLADRRITLGRDKTDNSFSYLELIQIALRNAKSLPIIAAH